MRILFRDSFCFKLETGVLKVVKKCILKLIYIITLIID